MLSPCRVRSSLSPTPSRASVLMFLQRGRPSEQAAAGMRVDPEKAPRAREAAAAAAKAPKPVIAAGTCPSGSDSRGTCIGGQVRHPGP